MRVGIDLGTTNSLIAYYNEEKAAPELIPNQFGNFLTPSVIYVNDSGELMIGDLAKANKVTHPKQTAWAFKRFMGLDKKIKLGFNEYTPVELSALVLIQLKKDAEIYLGESIDSAVISVPAFFNSYQREATLLAAKIAELPVSQLISEPTAASLAYGITRADQDQTFMVVDLGGGTFDVSLISMFANMIQVDAISGDNQLGGEDFTNMIVNEALKVNQLARDNIDIQLLSKIYEKAEVMKKKFSNRDLISAEFTFTYAETDYHFIINKKRLREIFIQLLSDFQTPIKNVLNDSSIMLEEIDKVILVGGGTRLALVQQALSKITGIQPSDELNPDEVIALGAAIRAHMVDNRESLIMTDVIGFSLGTAVNNKVNSEKTLFDPIIERNSVIPTSVEKQYTKAFDEQTVIDVKIYQGENMYADENIMLGKITYPVASLGTADLIKVRYTYNESGILEVNVHDSKTDRRKDIIIQNRKEQLPKDQLERVIQRLATCKIDSAEQSENKLILARLERLYTLLLDTNRERIQAEIQRFNQILESENPHKIYLAQKRANEIIAYYGGII